MVSYMPDWNFHLYASINPAYPLRYKPPAAFAASEEAAPGGIPFGTLFSSSSVPFVDISLINSPVLIEPMVVEFMALQLCPNVTKKQSERPFIHDHSTFRIPQSELSSENAADRVYISVNAEVLTIQDIDLTSGSVFGASRSPCPKRSEPAPGGNRVSPTPRNSPQFGSRFQQEGFSSNDNSSQVHICISVPSL